MISLALPSGFSLVARSRPATQVGGEELMVRLMIALKRVESPVFEVRAPTANSTLSPAVRLSVCVVAVPLPSTKSPSKTGVPLTNKCPEAPSPPLRSASCQKAVTA